MSVISAVEIKRHGVSALSPVLQDDGEALITVRGKAKYVVMTMQKYNELREADLAQAVRESRADYDAGRIVDGNIEDHIRRISDEV